MFGRRLAVALLLASGVSAVSAEPSEEMQRLDWLLGAWTFEDTQVGGDYRESGTRDCAWALNDQYILCTSHGRSHTGAERDYLWYFNYNRMEQRYEMSALNSSWPRKDLYQLKPSDDDYRWSVDTMTWSETGLEVMNTATVTYNGKDRYVWEIRTAEPDPESGAYTVRFRDVVTRVSAD